VLLALTALGQHTRLFEHSPLVGVSSCSVLAAGQQKHSLPVTPDGQPLYLLPLESTQSGKLRLPLLSSQARVEPCTFHCWKITMSAAYMPAFGQQIEPRLPLLLRSISHHSVMPDRH
jgi:hypothetical protein